ncbi:MAG: hypothetical protein F4X56_09390 [Gammaproteobacteria bacterium]|nr:hypothetical protein [Gammaproteobacteria bacterium]
MAKRLLPLICFISISSYAHHQFFLESKSLQQIGDATVSVSFDRLHDTYHWLLHCYDKSSAQFPPMGVLVTCEEVAQFGVSFMLSEAPETDSTELQLQYRFDDGEPTSVETKIAHMNPRHAIVEFDKENFSTFLEGLAVAKKIVFSVGTVEDTLHLKEMSEAVDEYRKILADSYIIELESDMNNDADVEPTIDSSENEEDSSTESEVR